MNKVLLLAVTFMFLAASVGRAFAEPSVRVLDRIIAVIDGEPVTSTEFNRYMRARGEAVPPAGFNYSSPVIRKSLEDFIHLRLVELEASKAGIQVDEEQISNYIEQIKKQNGVDQPGLVDMLTQQGMSLEQYKEQVRYDIIQARLLSTKVRNKVHVVDEDVERYLQEHPELIPEPGAMKLVQYSVVLPEKNLSDEQKKPVEALRSKVSQGEEVSAGAGLRIRDIGYVDPDNLKQLFSEVVRGKSEGEVSEVVFEDGMAHFFRVVHVQGEDAGVDEATRRMIVERLQEKEFRQATENYFTKKLPERYSVEYKL